MKVYKTASYQKISKGVKGGQKKEAQEIWTPQMEEELEQKELEKKKERMRLRDDFISPHMRRPGKGRGVPRLKQRRGLEEIVTDDDWDKLVDKIKNKELEEERFNII